MKGKFPNLSEQIFARVKMILRKNKVINHKQVDEKLDAYLSLYQTPRFLVEYKNIIK
jgi:hypothetical protein